MTNVPGSPIGWPLDTSEGAEGKDSWGGSYLEEAPSQALVVSELAFG